MEIGNEISQKVRSAIKAKLVDLGAYVDDELPDYIMVMVANKKSRDQMTDDLNLFLGHNTEKFTAWLCALLEKLQSIATTDESPAAPVPQTTAPSDNQSTAAVTASEEPNTRPAGDLKRSTSAEVKRSANGDRKRATDQSKEPGDPPLEPSRKRTSSTGPGLPTTSPQGAKKARPTDPEGSRGRDQGSVGEQRGRVETQRSRSREEPHRPKDEPHRAKDEPHRAREEPSKKREPAVVPEITLAAEKDALFEEEVEASVKSAGLMGRHTHRQTTDATRKPSRNSTTEGTRSDAKETSTRSGESSTASRTSKDQIDPDRRRRPLTSAIGAVVSRPSAVEEEEPYDPFRPAIGKVASQVKITERKSKVPTTWQADKSILLKAVSAAQVSIEKSSRHREKAVVKPVSHDPKSSRSRSSAHSRLHRPRSPPHRGMRSDRRRSRSRDRGRRSRSRDRGQRSRSRDRRSRSPRSQRSWAVRTSGERKITVFSRNHDDDEVFSRITTKVKVKKETDAERKDEEGRARPEGDDNKDDVYDDDILELCVPEDHRLIEYELDTDSQSAPAYTATPIRPGASATLIESGADESDFTDGEGDNRHVRQRARRSSRSPSPKFVVTLDGVDPRLVKVMADDLDSTSEVVLSLEDDDEGGTLGEDSEVRPLGVDPPRPRNIVRVEPRPHQPSVQPVTIVSLRDDDDYDGDRDSVMAEVPEKPAVADKCHFWPSCKNGEACPYYHPTENCRKFPRCKFGDKCLYVHPQCKFDAQCTKPACPFSHTTRRNPAAFPPTAMPVIVQPIRMPMYPSGGFYRPSRPTRPPGPQTPAQVTCRFYPQCTNMTCPFNHPKPCRFGISCSKKSTCTFTHPKLPTKDKLSWSTRTPTKELSQGPLVSPGVSPILSASEPISSTPK